MENEVIVREQPSLTAAEIRTQVNLIQSVMQAVMKKDTHYGIVPGCQKPSLWKPGAEKLMVTFRIASDAETQDLSGPDVARYRVTRKGFSILTGAQVGSAVGECSSDEEKYKWRGAVCEAEFEATPEDRRRLKYKRDGATIKQVRTNPPDVANTVLRMADKRAYVALALNVTAASDIFTQDIEDLPEGMVPEATAPAAVAPPKVRDAAASPEPAGAAEWEVSFVPTAVSKKAGEKNGKTWTKYGVKSPSGEWFGTFDSELGELAEQAKEEKFSVCVSYKIDGAYKNIVWLEKVA